MAPTTRGWSHRAENAKRSFDESPPAAPPRQTADNRLHRPPRWLTERLLTLCQQPQHRRLTPPAHARRQRPATPARASRRIAQSAHGPPLARAQPREDYLYVLKG